MSYRDKANVEQLRQQRHHREQEQPDVRTILHELSPEPTWIEPSVRSVLHALGVEPSMRRITLTHLLFALALMWPASLRAQTSPALPPVTPVDGSSALANDTPAPPAPA